MWAHRVCSLSVSPSDLDRLGLRLSVSFSCFSRSLCPSSRVTCHGYSRRRCSFSFAAEVYFMEMLIVRVGRLDHSTGIAFLIAGVTPPVAVTLLLVQSSSVFVSIRIRTYLYRFTPVSISIDFIFCSFNFHFSLGFFLFNGGFRVWFSRFFHRRTR